MTNKFLILITLVAFSALALAAVVVARIGSPVPTTVVKELPPQPPMAPAGITIRAPQMVSSLPAGPTSEEQMPIFTQPLANAVNTSDLSNLAHQVHLKNSDLASVNKSEWQKALPKAKQLLQGACDCEERNWLNHFIETGSDAIAGSKDYDAAAKLLVSLPKNDEGSDEARRFRLVHDLLVVRGRWRRLLALHLVPDWHQFHHPGGVVLGESDIAY